MLPPAQRVPARGAQDQAVGASEGVSGVGYANPCQTRLIDVSAPATGPSGVFTSR